jgi:hypothetical protein
MEVFVEAALALCSTPPRSLTSRVVHSMPLLAELNRPVMRLDGRAPFDGWQAGPDDPRTQVKNYLADSGH